MFGQTNLGLVAYASVLANGTSPNTNSGVGTTRLALGEYAIDLPTNLWQASEADLIFVQIKGPVPGITASETDTNVQRKLIHIGSSTTTAIDAEFDVIIYRSLISPPLGAPY